MLTKTTMKTELLEKEEKYYYMNKHIWQGRLFEVLTPQHLLQIKMMLQRKQVFHKLLNNVNNYVFHFKPWNVYQINI